MRIRFKTGDIVEEQVEGLVCSGNVQLNMSGGVNGELLLRGGQAMQEQLHDYLRQAGRRYVEPGFVMAIGPEPTHFRCIVYTVAIDAFCDSSVKLVCKALTNGLHLLQEVGCRSAAIRPSLRAMAICQSLTSDGRCGSASRRAGRSTRSASCCGIRMTCGR